MANKYVIGLTEPASVLQDFESLLNFIGEDGELVSKKQMIFGSATLIELNQKMTKPVQQDKSRPTPKTFPHIEVLYLCAKWLGFFQYVNEGTRKRVHLNSRAIEAWQERNLTEQYFSLLEMWLFGDPNDCRTFLPPISRLDWFLGTFFGKTADDHNKLLKSEYKIGGLLAGLELFGLVAIQHAEPDAGGGWKIDEVVLTPFGKFAIQALSTAQKIDDDYIFNRMFKEEEFEKDLLLKIFQADFPDFVHPYSLPEEVVDRDGVFIFKVSLGKVWRRIAIVSQADLDGLAAAILDAFGFDNDHLYYFKFLSTQGVLKEYYHPASMDSELVTDEVNLAELPLPVKSNMEFVFDFGDWWEFEVLLEKIVVDYKLDYCEIVDSKGEPPEQYPDESDW